MRRVLLDLNIALDIFLARQPWSTEAAAIWKANHEGSIDAYFASVSVPTLFYVIRKQRGLVLAQMAVEDCLNSLTIIPVSLSTLRLAAAGPGTDLEDNLQIASAVESGLDAIVTRDPKGFAGSAVPALSPTELLVRLSKDEDD
jgi:predicted nucleic acid-binding protein